MVQYWWKKGSREEPLKMQERRDSFWNEILKGEVMGPRHREGWRQGRGWYGELRKAREVKVKDTG